MALQDPRRERPFRWLAAACGCWLRDGAAELPAVDDWEALARAGYFHQLDPLLHRLLGEGRLGAGIDPPRRVRRQWEEAYFKNYIFNTELVERLSAVLDGCRDRGLQVAVFKGPVTAARGYGELALRIMVDLDLLCHRPDLPDLAEIAAGAGFRPAEQTAAHHLGFYDPDLGAGLELHFELYDVVASGPELQRRLWCEPDTVEIEGVAVPAPSPELALVLDLAHLVEHDFELNLRSWLDLATTLARGPARRPATAELLDLADLAPEMSLALAVLTRDLGWPQPEPATALPEPHAPAPLRRSILERLQRPEEVRRRPALSGPHRRGGAAATTRYVLRRLFPPLEQLRAQTGARTRTGALLGLPRHLGATLRRAAHRWRHGGLRATPEAASPKAALYRRRATTPPKPGPS